MARSKDTADDVAAAILAPRANPDLIGHGVAEARLKRAFGSGKLAHAWLICGPRGIGKATLAYRFARYVLAQGGHGPGAALAAEPSLFGPAPPSATLPGGEPGAGEGEGLYLEPNHPVFRRVAAQGHADLFTVERAFDEKKGTRRSEIVVDDVRGVGGFLSLTAAEGGWRVVVVDSADEMNRNAANAILKVLEEPPKRALLLLVSHNPGALLPTIRSRCQRLVLDRLADAQVAELLRRLDPGLSPAETQAIAHLAEGSVDRAIELADEDGLALHREMGELLRALPDLDGVLLHRFAEKAAKGGAEGTFRTACEIMGRWLARLAVAAATRMVNPAGVTETEAAQLARLAGLADAGRWLDARDKIEGLFERTEAVNLDRKTALLDAFFLLRAAARA